MRQFIETGSVARGITFDDLPRAEGELKWLVARDTAVKLCPIFQSSLHT